MAKLIVTLNGLIQQELAITKSRLTMGRRPSNDLVLDHLTVSGQHAALDTTVNGSFILDLGSTNGTMVNGQPIKKHLLQHEDVIDIGKYKLRFEAESARGIAGAAASVPAPARPVPTVVLTAKVKILTGRNAGRELVLSKPVTTLGTPGALVIAITRQEGEYVLAFVEGTQKPLINDRPLSEATYVLRSGDVLELSGTRMEFVHSAATPA